MRVVISTLGKFHYFDLARQLVSQGHAVRIFSAYPRAKLRRERIPSDALETFPAFTLLYALARKCGIRGVGARERLARWSYQALDRYVARRMPPCDVFVGQAWASLSSGHRAHQLGASYVCDMGSTHIQFQDRILREECELLGLPADAISPELVQRGILEYECADCISVISTFAQETFAQEGIPPAKVKKAILGVDTERFTPTGAPDDSYFDVLFVGALSSRKGITYLLQAFEMLPHARKRLTLVGDKSAQTEVLLATSPPGDNVRILGHVPQLALRDIMSRSHVLVLPSIEDGFGMVMSQAMACGCPVIATVNTGGRDIIRDRITGYIVPIRSPGRICEALIDIAGRKDGESLRKLVRQETESMGGWAQYGAQMVSHYQDAIGGPR